MTPADGYWLVSLGKGSQRVGHTPGVHPLRDGLTINSTISSVIIVNTFFCVFCNIFLYYVIFFILFDDNLQLYIKRFDK